MRNPHAPLRPAISWSTSPTRRPGLVAGQEVSAKQLLAQGYKTVLETMDGQPMLHAELLRSIGFAQIGMFNFPAMDEAFAQATLQFQRAETRVRRPHLP